MKDRKNNKKRTGSNSRPSLKKFSDRPSFSKQASVDAENIVIGRNPVLELIKSGRTVEKIYIAHGEHEGSIKKIIAMAREAGLVIVEADKAKLENICGSKNHQGILAFCTDYTYFSVEEILDYVDERNEKPFLLVLDGIQDPGNLGALIRTANASGVHGIILPKRGACGLTAAVFKAAAGACEYVRLARVTNITDTIEQLKKRGVWIYGADGDAEKDMYGTDFSGATAIVLGEEGKGLSRLVKEHCDFLTKIPMCGQINSLNVSVAGGVFMYEVFRQRKE